MKVEIWSDIVCPFCYIGKRKFEQALAQFTQKEEVEIIWKSFQLDPNAPVTGSDYQKYLSERKGWSAEQTRQITDNVRQSAKEVGLDYHFDKAVAANSFDAHRFAHLAQSLGKQDAAEEALFRAHFSEGKNIADHATLTQLGATIGLKAEEVSTMLEGYSYTEEVQKDMAEARQFGINGVPFFVFDRKYAVSGAQDTAVFLQTLEKTFDSLEVEK